MNVTELAHLYNSRPSTLSQEQLIALIEIGKEFVYTDNEYQFKNNSLEIIKIKEGYLIVNIGEDWFRFNTNKLRTSFLSNYIKIQSENKIIKIMI